MRNRTQTPLNAPIRGRNRPHVTECAQSAGSVPQSTPQLVSHFLSSLYYRACLSARCGPMESRRSTHVTQPQQPVSISSTARARQHTYFKYTQPPVLSVSVGWRVHEHSGGATAATHSPANKSRDTVTTELPRYPTISRRIIYPHLA